MSATDSGQPEPLSDVTEVEVSVLDVNDNAPRFSKEEYTGSLSENAPVGTKVRETNGSRFYCVFSQDVGGCVLVLH